VAAGQGAHGPPGTVLDEARERGGGRRGRARAAVEQVALRRGGRARRLHPQRQAAHRVGQRHALALGAQQAAPRRGVGGVAGGAHAALDPAAAGEREGEGHRPGGLAALAQRVAHLPHEAAGHEHQPLGLAQGELGPLDRRRRALARRLPEDAARVVGAGQAPERDARRPEPHLDRRGRHARERAARGHAHVGQRGGRARGRRRRHGARRRVGGRAVGHGGQQHRERVRGQERPLGVRGDGGQRRRVGVAPAGRPAGPPARAGAPARGHRGRHRHARHAHPRLREPGLAREPQHGARERPRRQPAPVGPHQRAAVGGGGHGVRADGEQGREQAADARAAARRARPPARRAA
jgi:hypothetical protein